MKFEDDVIKRTVDKLISGEDYREEIVNSISVFFFDFTIDFFKKIVDAKMSSRAIDINWYKEYFLNKENYTPEEIAIFAGMNKKTITNIYGTSKKNIMIDVANDNFDYLSSLISELEEDSIDGLAISIKLSYNNITVELSLQESLLVINALATKKLQIRGGAWSSIGKKVEKPLIDKLCDLVGVPQTYRDNTTFIKDKDKLYDREVDYKLFDADNNTYRVEVKLMGKGNSESADAVIARNSDIFIADTLSKQNRDQLRDLGIEYVELKNNDNIINDFANVMDRLNIPRNL